VFKLKKKNLKRLVVFACLLFLASALIPALRPSLLSALRYPLAVLNSLRREIGALIFYHHNYVQNERLRKEVDFLNQKINSLNEVALENRRLRALLSLKEKTPFKVIAARVIARAPDNWSSLVFLDKGSHQGIRRGMAVITYLGLVGRVVDTAENTSKVMLVNDPDFAVSAIDQRSREEGLLCGTLGSSLLLRYLPKDADIQIADKIFTSGLTQMYPKGLFIGRVSSVGQEFSGLSIYAVVRPAVVLSSIEEVLIIVP